MNYEAPITTQVKEILDLIDLSVSPEEIGTLERQLNEDDFKLAEWLAEEESKPELVRDLKREQIAVESLTARIEAILKPVRESKKKSSAVLKEREEKKLAALAECNAICQRAHKELAEALQKHGVSVSDTTEVIAKTLAYTGLAK
ncbi:hypothetical protein VCSRO155_1582 [Vibrio cholerae]|uniref:hypothetical protein n=1 Tax=Vibrio paracholerae TaxID=650003 RepID=UPI0004E3F8C0|nr:MULTISPECIES: hypothetical protein [Vibrio]KFD80070.1 hypothetical protein DA89_2607 [Vibrio paracholerae]QAV05667.1 hypothetical protein FORC76_2170 [Vibrio cholerae]GHW94830.1 hypothetical protein VCSRO155_1582 [Vibrio cholerae]